MRHARNRDSITIPISISADERVGHGPFIHTFTPSGSAVLKDLLRSPHPTLPGQPDSLPATSGLPISPESFSF